VNGNVIANLGRAEAMHIVATWLARHPALPIDSITFTATGEVFVTATPSDDPALSYGTAREVDGLYELADAVGAEVSAPARRDFGHRWCLTVRWRAGVVPLLAQIYLRDMATNVRLAGHSDRGTDGADRAPNSTTGAAVVVPAARRARRAS
jgi:hypothetical protein